MVTKRYLIPILLGMLVFVLGITVGCGQNQKQEEINECLYYLDNINTSGLSVSTAIDSLLEADGILIEVCNLQDESRLLEASALEKSTASQALALVNSELSTLENVIPPREAQNLHSTFINCLSTAQSGLVKWSHASAINYERAYELLNPSVPPQEFPSCAEEMSQARQLVYESLDMMEQVFGEWDTLLQYIQEKAKT